SNTADLSNDSGLAASPARERMRLTFSIAAVLRPASFNASGKFSSTSAYRGTEALTPDIPKVAFCQYLVHVDPGFDPPSGTRSGMLKLGISWCGSPGPIIARQ